MTQASDPNIAAKVQHLNNGDSLIIKSAAGTASAGTESVEWIAIGTKKSPVERSKGIENVE